jgi:hypothetical protein
MFQTSRKERTMERRSRIPSLWVGLSVLGAAAFCFASEVSKAQLTTDPAATFERLKRLNGEWQGTVESRQGPAATVLYRLTANGKTLMETLFPGMDHEMISMYHLDGKDLVVSHYCAVGNQPRMKLTSASPSQLIFDFAGGTNLDPKKDVHIHSGKLIFVDDDHLESEWAVYQGEKQVGSNKFFLTRRSK